MASRSKRRRSVREVGRKTDLSTITIQQPNVVFKKGFTVKRMRCAAGN